MRHSLEPDPDRAPVVRRIYTEYLHGNRSISVIARRLNADLLRITLPRRARIAAS